MRILQITKKFPYPLNDGESIAVHSLCRGMVQLGWTFDILSLNTSKHPFEEDDIPNAFSHYTKVFYYDINTKVTLWGAFTHLLKGKSYQAERFIDQGFDRKIREVLSNNAYDIVQLESFYLAPYIPTIRKFSNAHISMRSHNVEHMIWHRLAVHSSTGLRKWYFNRIANELRMLETRYLQSYDSLVAISAHDLAYFRELGYRGPSVAIPIGLDLDEYPNTFSNENYRDVSFIGSLDWKPNIQGLNWFLDEVWRHPFISKKNLTLHVAGKGADRNLKARLQSVPQTTFYGVVPCANQFLSDYPVMVVPLLSGSGMRVKIIEGMAKGMLIITTTCGLEGIHATNGEHVIVADQPEQFAKAIQRVLDNPDEANRIRKKALSFVKNHYSYDSIASQLHHFYLENGLPKLKQPKSIVTFDTKS